MNSFLKKGKQPNRLVEDLFEDLKDGEQLMNVLAVLCPDDTAVGDSNIAQHSVRSLSWLFW